MPNNSVGADWQGLLMFLQDNWQPLKKNVSLTTCVDIDLGMRWEKIDQFSQHDRWLRLRSAMGRVG